MRVVVFGAEGRLGRRLVQQFDGHAEVVSVGRFPRIGRMAGAQHDEDMERVRSFVQRDDIVINAIAYTSVTRAEVERVTALEANGHAAQQIAAACDHLGAKLIYVSTDYVFDWPWHRDATGMPRMKSSMGVNIVPMKSAFEWREQPQPWVASDPVSPTTWYARTKLAGENATLEHGGTVVRMSFIDPNDVAVYGWLNGFTLATREWIESAAARLADFGEQFAASNKKSRVVHLVDPDLLPGVTVADLVRDRFPNHPALRNVVTRQDLRADFIAGFPLPLDVRLQVSSAGV